MFKGIGIDSFEKGASWPMWGGWTGIPTFHRRGPFWHVLKNGVVYPTYKKCPVKLYNALTKLPIEKISTMSNAREEAWSSCLFAGKIVAGVQNVAKRNGREVLGKGIMMTKTNPPSPPFFLISLTLSKK